MFRVFFWFFWLAIQNTTNRQVSNAFELLAVFISLPLLSIFELTIQNTIIPQVRNLFSVIAVFISFSAACCCAKFRARCCAPASRTGGRGDGPGKLIPRL